MRGFWKLFFRIFQPMTPVFQRCAPPMKTSESNQNFFLHLSIEKEIVGRTKRKTGEKNGGIESNDLNRYNL